MFFRARVTAEPDQYLGKMEMFHVPFNKRYNLRNERFSLTGQPILYLGNSIPDLLEEMEISSDDQEAMKRVRISSFEFTKSNWRIYDLRCNIEEMLKHSETKFTKQDFYRNLLSFICGFEKRRELADSAFKEEYAIPQMLTQVLKKNKYHGICYYSTKPFHGYYIPEEMTNPIYGGRNLLFRENFAVFTTLGDRKGFEIYDMELFDALEISMPISINTMCRHSANELEQLLLSIKKQKVRTGSDEAVKYIKKRNEKAESIVKFYGDVFSKMTVNKIPYSDTPMGEIHTQLLLGILNRLLVDIEHESYEEQNLDKQNELSITKPDCMVEVCDIEGNRLGKEDAAKAHKIGQLHLAQVVFVQKKDTDSNCKIASWSKNWNALFYHHSTAIDEEMRSHGFEPPTEKKKIGSFLHQEHKIGGQLVNEMGLQTDFEYIEVYLCDVQCDHLDNSFDSKFSWKNREDLRSDLERYYSSMNSVYQQALTILLSYLKKESE